MKVRITDDCVSCGVCVDICSEVFDLGSDYAEVKTNPVPAQYQDAVREAVGDCPTSSIIVD